MTKNPLLNALAASGYITLIAMVMNYASTIAPHPKTIIVPIAVLSLFTLSAAVMGFIFLSNPVQLYLDGKKKEAISLFLQTVAVFTVITAFILFLLFSGIFGK